MSIRLVVAIIMIVAVLFVALAMLRSAGGGLETLLKQFA